MIECTYSTSLPFLRLKLGLDSDYSLIINMHMIEINAVVKIATNKDDTIIFIKIQSVCVRED